MATRVGLSAPNPGGAGARQQRRRQREGAAYRDGENRVSAGVGNFSPAWGCRLALPWLMWLAAVSEWATLQGGVKIGLCPSGPT
jgi:hypothetical protein